MSRVILIILIILILIVVILGVFYLFSGKPLGQSSNSMFEIQGMKVETLKQGTGNEAKAGDSVTVHYVGTLENGQKFDSSIDRNAPYTFKVGAGRVIRGWDLGVAGMKVGEKRKLTVPPNLAYGAAGFPPIIPQNATLNFEVEMLKIVPAPVKK